MSHFGNCEGISHDMVESQLCWIGGTYWTRTFFILVALDHRAGVEHSELWHHEHSCSGSKTEYEGRPHNSLQESVLASSQGGSRGVCPALLHAPFLPTLILMMAVMSISCIIVPRHQLGALLSTLV